MSLGESHFRTLLPQQGDPKYATLSTDTARAWYEGKKDLAHLKGFLHGLEAQNVCRPYKGFTSDGNVIKELFKYASEEGAPVEAMVQSASSLVDLLSPEQKQATLFPSVDDDEIRIWSNPEFYINLGGIRLDECTMQVQDAIHAVIQSSLSPAGYTKAYGCCLVNGFLGKLLNGERVLNEHSYNFRLFGEPSLTEPWGYTFFGHHLCLAVVVLGGSIIIGPTFMGAEPDCIDEGPHSGLRLFSAEKDIGLRLMQGLSSELREAATLWPSNLPESLPSGRWVPHDERHVGGAGQDNRVVPYEGCLVSRFSAEQKQDVVKLFLAFNEYYPAPVLEHRMALFGEYLDKTWFAWIGGYDDESTFYFRIHSPVSFMEFDFHSGVFLKNEQPDKCHIHTINRIPNQGDYGKALVAQYRSQR